MAVLPQLRTGAQQVRGDGWGWDRGASKGDGGWRQQQHGSAGASSLPQGKSLSGQPGGGRGGGGEREWNRLNQDLEKQVLLIPLKVWVPSQKGQPLPVASL
jgi:hypothetical protein